MRRQAAPARTHPAESITTPELSPCTATGVFRDVVVPSPSCASHKASHAHHAAATNMCSIPTSPKPVRPRTCPEAPFPQHHKPPDDPAIAHVYSCILACKLSSRSQKIIHTHISLSTPQYKPHCAQANTQLQTFKQRTHTNQTHQHHTPSKCNSCTQDRQPRNTINNIPQPKAPTCAGKQRTWPAATITTPACEVNFQKQSTSYTKTRPTNNTLQSHKHHSMHLGFNTTDNAHSIADKIQATMRTEREAIVGWGSKTNQKDTAQPSHVDVFIREFQNFARSTAQSRGTKLRMQRAAARTCKGYDEWQYFERFVLD